jgi:acetyltransferase-like isoleucine patch superfamily enzyme
MKIYTKKQLKRLRIALIFESKKRTKYIVNHNVFHSVGKDFFFQPRFIPSDPELISFHDNVTVASNVTFITHDIAHNMLNNIGKNYYCYNTGCIEIMNNVFIGSNSTILPNIRIGSNVIIAAGSVVTKDIPDNSVVAGVPAKVIESFDEYISKRSNLTYLPEKNLWEKFYLEKGIPNEKN